MTQYIIFTCCVYKKYFSWHVWFMILMNKSRSVPVAMSPYHPFYLFPPLSTESAYDLLPRELQLPSSTQQSPKVMSQKSGGEAGPPPSAALASGRILFLLSLFLLCKQDWSCPTPKNTTCATVCTCRKTNTCTWQKSLSMNKPAALWSSRQSKKKMLKKDFTSLELSQLNTPSICTFLWNIWSRDCCCEYMLLWSTVCHGLLQQQQRVEMWVMYRRFR